MEISFAVITLSDKGSRGQRQDTSGPLIRQRLEKKGFRHIESLLLPDEKEPLMKALIELSEKVDLILTTGGTGLSPRDITPEVTLEVIEKEVPGIAEAMRLEGLKKTPHAMLSRAVAGIRGNCLIINLPGSPKAVEEGLQVIEDVLEHAIEKIKGSERECAR